MIRKIERVKEGQTENWLFLHCLFCLLSSAVFYAGEPQAGLLMAQCTRTPGPVLAYACSCPRPVNDRVVQAVLPLVLLCKTFGLLLSQIIYLWWKEKRGLTWDAVITSSASGDGHCQGSGCFSWTSPSSGPWAPEECFCLPHNAPSPVVTELSDPPSTLVA